MRADFMATVRIIQLHHPLQLHDKKIQKDIFNGLKSSGFDIVPYEIDIADYQKYLDLAQYPAYSYLDGGKNYCFPEKSLEHYLAFKFLELGKDDIYIDIANNHSPVPEIYTALSGCVAYRQDMIFPAGIHGNTMGGNASELPVCDNFATRMALHCSFEHFEGESDINFIKEVRRVLNPGGKLCILPLYLFNQYSIQLDPEALPSEGMDFETDATLYLFEDGFRTRHARFYNIAHLTERICKNLGDLQLKIFYILNEDQINSQCYVKFVALIEKPQNNPPHSKNKEFPHTIPRKLKNIFSRKR